MSIADQRSPENAGRAEMQPLSINVSPHVANKLCNAFKKSARRRDESGGLLFGEVQNPIVHVRAFKSFPDRVWQTARIPQATLNGMLTACRADPDLSGLDWVGWYSLRASAGLSQSDFVFHNAHFHRPSDIALIVRLENSATVLLDFYSRSGVGALTNREQRRGAVSVSWKRIPLEPIQVIVRDTSTAPPLALEERPTTSSEGGEPPHERIRQITTLAGIGSEFEPQPKDLSRTSEDVAGLQSQVAIDNPPVTSANAARPWGTPQHAPHVSSVEPGDASAPHLRPDVAPEVTGVVPVSTAHVEPRSQKASPEASAAKTVDTPEGNSLGSIPAPPAKAPAERFAPVARPQSGAPVRSSQIPKAPVLGPREPTPDISPAQLRPEKVKRPVFLIATGSVALLLLAVLGSAVVFYIARPQSHPASSTEVGLRVLRLDRGQLDLGWNRDAPAIRRAQTAKLFITDGPLHEELNMGSAQLHLGRLTYSPAGSDVQFRLEVFVGDKRSVTESVRVIAPAVNQLRANPTSKRGMPASKGPVHRPGASYQGTGTFVPSAPEDGNLHGRFKSPNFVPTSTRPSAYESSHIMPPPDIRGGGANKLPSPVLATALPKLAAAPAAAPVHSPLHPSAELHNAQIPAFAPPHPVRQVMPDIRSLSLSNISVPTEIAISVKIDEFGTVYDASPVDKIEPLNRLLVDAAVMAAKQWKFTPATIRGKAVATEHTIVFEFRPRVR